MNRNIYFIISFLFFLFIFSLRIYARNYYVNPNFKKIIKKKNCFTIAVLPVENRSPNPKIAISLRERIIQRLLAKGYNVINPKILDKKLLELGIQNKTQISLLDFKTIANLTSADAILASIIETGTEQHALVFNGYAYTVSMKLTYKTGEDLWYNLSERVAQRRFALDPVNMFIDYAVTQTNNFEKDAIYALVDKILKNLPGTKVKVVNDNWLDKATEIK